MNAQVAICQRFDTHLPAPGPHQRSAGIQAQLRSVAILAAADTPLESALTLLLTQAMSRVADTDTHKIAGFRLMEISAYF